MHWQPRFPDRIWPTGAFPIQNDNLTLAAITEQAKREIELTIHPRADWMPRFNGPDTKPVLNVLIVGGGQGGAALAFQLKRDCVSGVLAVDQAPAGREGPWRTYARMPTLRSPKEYTGPDLGIPGMTYRIWHEARYGAAAWDALELIRTEDWAEYLLWVRDVTDVEVRNQTTVTEICPVVPTETPGTNSAKTLFRVSLMTDGQTSHVYARKIVLASGQDGAGQWWAPDYITALPAEFWAHTAEPIDFASLAGKKVAVIGAGASASDSAAMALEHGAASVDMFVRRKKMQRIQPYRWITFTGFLRHLSDLDDEWRWRFMQRVLSMRESIPQATYDRMRCHENFTIHTDRGWSGVAVAGSEHALQIETTRGLFAADYIIAGTGIDVDFKCKLELAPFADRIRTWTDAYDPPPEEADVRLGKYPYLDRQGAYMEKAPGDAPFLASIFDFTIAATMSLGPSGSSINAMTTAVPRLAAGITRSLFREDVEYHWDDFLAYDVPVFVPTGGDGDL